MTNGRFYLLGMVIGLTLCAGAGRYAAGRIHLDHFTRFFIQIQPQASYYPTLSQLINTARRVAAPDKTLVLVGSSSIFRGAGQNPDELWTLALQRHLGGDHVVLNYAIDNANISSFAGVAYRALRPIYPRIRFVSLMGPRGAAPIDGEEPYRYIFWDGYYKSLIPLSSSQLGTARERRLADMKTAAGQALHVQGWLDSVLFFNDLWNAVGYSFLSSVWASQTAARPFQPRGDIVEAAVPNLRELQDREDQDMAQVKRAVDFMESVIPEVLQRYQTHPTAFSDSYARLFDAEQRRDTLIVLPWINPAYLARLSPAVQRDIAALRARQTSELRALGFAAVEVGENWSPDDYMGLGHLSVSGGAKLAERIAVALKAMHQQP